MINSAAARLAEKENFIKEILDYLPDFAPTLPPTKKELKAFLKKLEAYPATAPTVRATRGEILAFHCFNCLKSWTVLTLATKAPVRYYKDNAAQFLGIALSAIINEPIKGGSD